MAKHMERWSKIHLSGKVLPAVIFEGVGEPVRGKICDRTNSLPSVVQIFLRIGKAVTDLHKAENYRWSEMLVRSFGKSFIPKSRMLHAVVSISLIQR